MPLFWQGRDEHSLMAGKRSWFFVMVIFLGDIFKL